MSEGKRVVIVGGGVQGMMIGYDLSAHGHEVTILEAGDKVGGLAGAMTIEEAGGIQIDRFYHCILSSDRHLGALFEELGLENLAHYTTTQMAFWGGEAGGGGLHQMSTPGQFLTFPLISPWARLRLGLSIVYSALLSDAAPLESISMEQWLIRIAGRENFERLWRPLLQSKFDDDFGDLPASYMWARLRRMMSTRDKRGAEQMGHLEGGYQTLIDALEGRIVARGGVVRTGMRVAGLVRGAGGRVEGVLACAIGAQEVEALKADAVVLTVGNRLTARLLGEGLPEETRGPLLSIGSMAIVCVVLVLDRALSPYYTINILDRAVSLTGVIETTNIIDPALLGGRHLIYLPKYCSQDSPLLERPDAEVLEDFLEQLGRVVPSFDRASVLATRVMRARETEPVHRMAPKRALVPYRPGPEGVFVANSTQVYPDLVNCEAMAANVRRALVEIHRSISAPGSAGATSLSR